MKIPAWRKALETRYLLKNGCKEWTGCTNDWGYGMVGIPLNGKAYARRVHRVAWEQAYGPIPIGLFVLHHCDNPPCYELTHLYVGTPADNMADRKKRGRFIGGVKHPRASFNTRQLTTVRRLLTRGDSHASIARRFDVDPQTISNIANGKTYQ